jgi:hypothetical protein
MIYFFAFSFFKNYICLCPLILITILIRMKKIPLLFAGLFAVCNLFAQKNNKIEKTVVITCSDFHITRPLSEIFAEHPVDETLLKKRDSEDRDERKPQKFKKSVKDGPEYGNASSSIQNEMGTIPNRAPITNWSGQASNNVRPMDPSGAAGPNHYVQMINSTTFKIYNKTSGTALLTGTFGSLWSPATGNEGDPVVLYDKTADRWFMSQFGSSSDNHIYIAISKTNDPTGAYYTYTFTSPEFPDYLKFAVWQDGYYMTSNQTQKVFCFERAAMLTGSPTARSLYTNFSPPQGSGFFVPLAGDTGDGALAPAGTPCPIFSYSDNGWGSGYNDAVNIYKMTVNWIPSTPTGTIASAGTVPTAAFDATYSSAWNDCPQPGTSQMLDGIGGVCNFRAQFKIWNGYNTVVLNWAVKISSTQRSIKWCELRQNQSSGVWSMYQEGIYTPDASTRWLGSIAMDNNGSIALCYLKSNTTSIYPSLCYAGRRVCDPLGTLPVAEVVAKAGTGSQTGTNRDGDYSSTWLDPDGITFWHTGEYMGSGGNAGTQIYSFQLPACANVAGVSIAQTAGTNPACAGASETFTATSTNGGTTPTYQWQVNGANVGTNSPTYTTTSLTNGQIVTCIMTSNMSGVIGSPATSNAITFVIGNLTPTIAISGNSLICSGASATFTAVDTNGGTTPSYQWQVNGANVGTNSPTYTSSGLTNGQVVTCILTSNLTCVSSPTATSNSITVVVNPSGTLPFIENFEGSTFPPNGWTIVNPDAPSVVWGTDGAKGLEKRAAAGNAGSTTGCVGIECYNYSDSTQIDDLISKSISLSGVSNAKMTFKRAYKSYVDQTAPGAFADGLSIFISTDCGATYGSALYFKKGAQLASNGSSTNSFTPSVAADWKMDSVDLSTFSGQNIIVKFEVSNKYGNNLYIDDININGTIATPTASVAISTSSGSTTICTGASVTFTATPTNGGTSPSYQWQVNGTNAGTNSPTFTTSSLTNGQVVTCIMTSNLSGVIGNPAASNTITITTTAPVPPSVAVAQTVGHNPSCAGASVTFTASPTNGGITPSYQWQVNGVNVGTNSAAYTSTTLANNDAVTCILTSNGTCISSTTATSSPITMIITPVPATPTISQNGDVLTSSATSGNQWYLNGSIITGATSQTYTCMQGGNYSDVVTHSGCSSLQSVATSVTTGIDVLVDSSAFSVYPNPSDGNFNIFFFEQTKSNYKIELINMLGQVVFKDQLINFSGQYSKSINISEYGKGIYTITLTNDSDYHQNVKKVVVE